MSRNFYYPISYFPVLFHYCAISENFSANFDKSVEPPDSRTKIYAAHMSRGRQQQLLIDICCPRPTSAANPPRLLSIVGTDGLTDGRTLDCLTLY